MEQIRHNETWPVIDREKLLRDSQDRELNRLFWVLESDQFSVFDVEDTLIQLWQNNPKARPYIAQFVNSQNSSLESILMRNTNNETRENPETTKRLNLYQNLTKDLQKSLQDIQKSLNDSTSLSLRAMDNIAWLFTDDTIFNTYNSSFESIKNQAKNILWRVQEIDISSLTTNQKEVYSKTISELNQILSLKLETTWFIQMAWNEIDQIPQNLNYTAHAIKWEVIWLYEWGKAIITWSIDLLTFMIKYPFNSKYRQEINKQAEIIYDFVKKEWLSWVGNKVYEALWKEMDRISKLPPEKQSQAIWEIAWNVISMLAVIKVGTTVASKLWKVGQAERLVGQAEATWNIARAEKVREIAQTLLASKRWLQSFEIILTWVAESVLLKWLSVSYKATLGFLENNHLSSLAKAELIEQKIQEARQMKSETPEEQQILERYIEELEGKKKELLWNKAEILDIIDNEFRDYKYFQDVLKKFILDEKHPMNIVNYLQNPETRNATIKELKEVLKLWENHVSHEDMVNIIRTIYEWENSTFNTVNFKKTQKLKDKLLWSNPELYNLNENPWYNQRKLLKEYAEKLRTIVLPELKSKLSQVIWNIPIENWFPSISARAKNADWIIDKIWRMRAWNDWKNPRLDYNLADMPDAVWWRIAVIDIKQLQEITRRLEEVFWKENIFEVDNFYTSSKRENSYRVITYTALVDWVPCEIQLTTLKSSLVADLWHNTWYKKIHELPEDVIEKLSNLQRQTTLHEHSLIK